MINKRIKQLSTVVAFAWVTLTTLASPVQAQHSDMNPALLGVIAAPATAGIEVLHVLGESPAEAAGLLAGDVLTRVGGAVLRDPGDLDQALDDVQPGSDVELEWSRDGESHTGQATVVNWRSYRGEFLRGRARGQTGFEAPDWYAYAWDHVEGAAGTSGDSVAPTRRNTAGKVVVIHAFQSW